MYMGIKIWRSPVQLINQLTVLPIIYHFVQLLLKISINYDKYFVH